MSATSMLSSISTKPSLIQFSSIPRTTFTFKTISFPSTPLSSNHLFLKHAASPKRTSTLHAFKRFSPVMQWQDCTVKMEIDVPISVAYAYFSDREAIPNWMPFVSSVSILPDKPDLSRWSMKYKSFGRDIEFASLVRHMQAKIANLIL